MKITFKYGEGVVNIPARAISEHLSDASREELCVLLALAENPESDINTLCERLGIDHEEFMKSLAFWRGSGVISVSLDEGQRLPPNRKKASSPKKDAATVADSPASSKNTTPLQQGTIPMYTTAEIADFLEEDASLRAFIDDCQQIMGKIFSSGEASSLIGAVKYLGVDTDYMALLCSFAAKHGKKSVRYVEKMALNLFDEGLSTYTQLEERLKILNRTEEMKPEIRRIFGLGERAFTTKEKRIIESWCDGDEPIPMELIVKAYEITVTNTGKPSLPYANSILESWRGAGYRTVAEVDEATAEYKRSKDSAQDSGSSFNTNDFFEAALRRSYGD